MKTPFTQVAGALTWKFAQEVKIPTHNQNYNLPRKVMRQIPEPVDTPLSIVL